MRFLTLLLAAGVVPALAACETPYRASDAPFVLPTSSYSAVPVDSSVPSLTDAEAEADDGGWRIEGREGTSGPAAPILTSRVRAFDMAFADAPVAVVADALLGRTMGRSYRVDPSIQGSLTLNLTGRMSEAEAIALFDRALRSVNAAVVTEGRGFAVVPEAQARRHVQSPVVDGELVTAGAAFYQAKNLGAAAIAALLEPLAGEGAKVQPDPTREQILITGDPETVNALMRTARSLDVDWLRGRSLEFIPMRYASPVEVAAEVRQAWGGAETPIGSQIQLLELPRLNGLLVIARSPTGLDRAGEWIRRFDRLPAQSSRRLRIMPVANLEAAGLVETVSSLVGEAAPAGGSGGGGGSTTPAAPTTTTAGAGTGSAEVSSNTTVKISADVNGLRLTADPRTNSMVLMANEAEYHDMLQIVRALDVAPPQVLIEATIAEVTLNDSLRFGVQWFLEGDRTTGGFSSGSDDSVAASFPGFSVRYLGGDVRAVLNALSTVTQVQLLSTPRLLVLSNESAELQVGDQVPIVTQTATGLNEDSRILNSIQYRDTGVVLSVTPRVTESGRMFIQIEQEVSEVSGTTSSEIDSPTIQQRRLSTRIQADDGQLVVMGGLMRTSRDLGDTGVPYLSRVPALGALFRSRNVSARQTELVMFLRPTVIRARADIEAVSQEMSSRLTALGMIDAATAP